MPNKNLSSEQLNSESIDLEELRERLRRMSDSELRKFGRKARNMCSPVNGKPPRQEFLVQVAEARAEWLRRQGLKES
jgi:hypothetical protein